MIFKFQNMENVLVVFIILCIFANISLAERPTGQCTTQKHRLRYHFSPRENWNNVPNGMVYYDGIYHLFYQYHPYSTQWGPMHWGHAISSNLVTWEEKAIALYPDDIGAMWAGSSVVDFKNTTGLQTNPDIHPIVAIYTSTGARGKTQSIAYSNDKGMTFQKFEGNPVLSRGSGSEFKDPKVFRDPRTKFWVMVLVNRNKFEFFGSVDMKKWTKLSEFRGEEGHHGGGWQCPNLVELSSGSGNKKLWVLTVTVGNGTPNGGTGTQYFIGNWNGIEFIAFPWQPTQWLDWGPDGYHGVTFSNDPENRTIAIGYMSNANYAGAIPTTTWRGQMTLPRQLHLFKLNVNATSNQYRVRSMPPEEVRLLRHPLQHYEKLQEFEVLPQSTVTLSDQVIFRNPSMEVKIALEMINEPKFSICAYNSLKEEVCFGYNSEKWFLDRTKSGNIGFNDNFNRSSFATAPRLQVLNDEQITTINMFLDTSSLEVFVDNGLTVMTSLFFPTENLDRLYIHHWSGVASGARLTVKGLGIWGLVCGVQNRK